MPNYKLTNVNNKFMHVRKLNKRASTTEKKKKS